MLIFVLQMIDFPVFRSMDLFAVRDFTFLYLDKGLQDVSCTYYLLIWLKPTFLWIAWSSPLIHPWAPLSLLLWCALRSPSLVLCYLPVFHPNCVMGGVRTSLPGFIAVSCMKMVQQVDMCQSRNLFVGYMILIASISKDWSFLKTRLLRPPIACLMILSILNSIMVSRAVEE